MVSKIKIDDVEYIRADAVHTGNRCVVVVDKGWIFAGDVERKEGRILITNAIHVFKWDSIGFAKMIETEKADLRPIYSLNIPEASEIFCVPVHDKWGIK